ncbi:MAG: hypothetical protein HDS52_02615 [Barnesiella sp.]|nr:hypothetical protein [Barnesiella sp.]
MKLLSTLLIALTASVASFAQTKQHYELKVNDFKELRVDNSVPVDYYCNPDSAGYAVFDATDAQASWILFDNNGRGKLVIQTDADYPTGEKIPRVRVYSTSLQAVTNSGDSLVKVNNLPSMDKFKATLIGNGRLSIPGVQASSVDAALRSGNGQLTVEGRCTNANLHLVGTGTILADRLDAVKVKASVVGTGSIGCNPSEAITVMGAGSGKVYYRKTPPTVKSRGVGIKHSEME